MNLAGGFPVYLEAFGSTSRFSSPAPSSVDFERPGFAMKFDAGRNDAMQAPLDAGKVWAILGLVFGDVLGDWKL